MNNQNTKKNDIDMVPHLSLSLRPPHVVSFQEGTNPPQLQWTPKTQDFVPLGPQAEQNDTTVDDLSDGLSSTSLNADEKEVAKMFDDESEPPPTTTSTTTTSTTTLPSVPLRKPGAGEKRKFQNRDAQRRHRKKRRTELKASRPTLALPAPRLLLTPIVHAASADISAVRARQREIENTLGIGRMSEKMLRRRESQCATRDRIIANLAAKLTVEKARKAEMDATQNGVREWLELQAQVSASKSVRKDQRDGDLLSESDSDSEGGLAQALPSVPKQKSLEARLLKL
jgi:hypothetical protein